MASVSDLRAEEVFETTRQPLVILGGDIRVVAGNHALPIVKLPRPE